MAQVIKVAKPDKNAITATSPDDFYMDSQYPLLKVHSFGTFNVNVALFPHTITHNLGYHPFALTFSQFLGSDMGAATVSEEYYQHDWYINGASARWKGQTIIYDDKIVIDVAHTSAASGTTVKGFYYIFKDPIA